MKKLSFSLVFILVLGLLTTGCKSDEPMISNTYILVHGAWHGAWCWKKVVPLLEAKGHKVIALDLPSHGNDKTPASTVSLNDCVKKIVETAKVQNGQVILVGHSMGGIVISQAAEQLGTQKVSKLVYLDAFLPKNGESVQGLAAIAGAATSPMSPTINDGLIISDMGATASFKPEIAQVVFYHDCLPADVEFAKANLCKQSLAVLGTPVQVSDEIYGKIPKFYILCTKSKDLDKTPLTTRVPIQKLFKLESSHSPFFSMPEQLVAIFDEI